MAKDGQVGLMMAKEGLVWLRMIKDGQVGLRIAKNRDKDGYGYIKRYTTYTAVRTYI